MDASRLAFGRFRFDPATQTLWRDDELVPLGTRATALLGALLAAEGGIVTKDSLIEQAWPGLAVEEANLAVQIAALRRALGPRPDGQEWIGTVARVGYRLHRDGAPEATRGPALAVLPFANLSSDPEQDHLADGFVEDLLTALSRFRTFAVVARHSSFVYKGRQVDARAVARELNVRYLLEGSVRRLGDRVRVTAQLIEGGSGAHLWAEKFDCPLDRIFDLQDEIIDAVVGLIEPHIRRAEVERARRKRPDSIDAWDLYVEALPLVYGSCISAYTEAVDLLERAIAIDPRYAPALALAAWAHEKRHTFGGPTVADADDAARALELAERSVAADPDDAMALAQLGWQRILFRRDWAGLALAERAVALNPNNLLALEFAGTAHLYAGDLNEVIRCHTRALQLSPGSPERYVSLSGLASGYFNLGAFTEARHWAEQTVAANPDYLFGYIFLAASAAHLGDMTVARAAIAAVHRMRPDYTVSAKSNAPMRFPERQAVFLEGLRKAGMPES